MKAVIRLLFILVFLALRNNAFGLCLLSKGAPTSMTVYSDVSYIEEEGEAVGLQLVLVPYADIGSSGLKVLWQDVEGKLEVPLLLDASQRSSTVFSINVPHSGEWEFVIGSGRLLVNGPNRVKFDLKEVSPCGE